MSRSRSVCLVDKVLSIIVPSYDMEKYLPRCLDSVLADESVRALLDIIVVNDGSKDRTSEIAHDFERRHPGVVRVIDKPNGHYGSAVNAGLAAAQGLYVKNLDADDTFDATGLARLLAQIETDRKASQTVDLYLTPFDHVDQTGRKTCPVSYVLPIDRIFGLGEILSGTDEISMHACAWRVGLLREIGYQQSAGIAYSDVEWILYPMLRARAIRYLPARVYLYLLGREGQTVSLAERRKNIGAWDVILDRIFATYRTQGAALSPAARDYLARVAIDMARMRLEAAFVLEPVQDASATISRLLNDLESAQKGLGVRLEHEARILKGSLNIPYLRIWRRLSVGKTALMRLVRGYLGVTRWIG